MSTLRPINNNNFIVLDSLKYPSDYFEKTVTMTPLRPSKLSPPSKLSSPSKLSPPSNDKGNYLSDYIQFLNKSVESPRSSPVPSISNKKFKIPSKVKQSKDIANNKLMKPKRDEGTVKPERQKSISKSLHKSIDKLLLIESVKVPSNETEKSSTLTTNSMSGEHCQQMCIESTNNATEPIRTSAEYVFNGNQTTVTSFSKLSRDSHHPTDCKSSQRTFMETNDATACLPMRNISNPKKLILSPPVLQTMAMKQNGESLLLTNNGQLHYASRPTTATVGTNATVAINQFKNPNGSAAVEVTNFLANPSIIKTK